MGFIAYIGVALDLPKTMTMFSRQNTELFGGYIFRSTHPELFYEKGVLNTCAILKC